MNRKKNDVMKLSDVQVVVGGKSYPAGTVDWIQTFGEYPMIRVEAPIGAAFVDYSSYYKKPSTNPKHISIKNVIFNPPATIVFWSDNTKTVVKCDDEYEAYDPEKGIAMAISKKLLGNNKYEYYNTFLHWLKKWDRETSKEVSE